MIKYFYPLKGLLIKIMTISVRVYVHKHNKMI